MKRVFSIVLVVFMLFNVMSLMVFANETSADFVETEEETIDFMISDRPEYYEDETDIITDDDLSEHNGTSLKKVVKTIIPIAVFIVLIVVITVTIVKKKRK